MHRLWYGINIPYIFNEKADIILINIRGLYRGFGDTGYLPFYFQGYRILSILLPGIWDTWFYIFVTSRDIKNLGKLIMGIFACLFQGIWDIWYPLYKPHIQNG